MVDKTEISRIFDEVIIKNVQLSEKCGRKGTTSSSGLKVERGQAPKYQLDDGGLTTKLLNQIADDMAERWGLEVSINSKGKREIGKSQFSLWDDKHKTLLRLNKLVKHQDWIDFTNNGNGAYDLDTVLEYYDSMPTRMKDATGGILFETFMGASYNTGYDGQYDIVNPVVISGIPFAFKEYEKSTNLQTTMYHEAGHACADVLPKDVIDVLKKSSVKKNGYDKSKLTTDAERQIYDDYFNTTKYDYPVSNTKEYDDGMSKNKVMFASEYGENSFLRFGGSRRREEDLAETLSIVAFKNINDKSNAKIKYSDGRIVGYDDFVKDHPGTVKFASDFLDGKINYDDLTVLTRG